MVGRDWGARQAVSNKATLQNEPIRVGWFCQPIQEALHREVLKQFLKRAALRARLVEQALPDGGADIASAHITASRYGRMTFWTRWILGEFCQNCSVWFACALTVCPQRFDRNVEPNLVPVLEAIGDSFFRRVDPDRNIVYGSHIDASHEGRLGIPENQKRDTTDFRNLCMARQRDINGVRNLGGEAVMC
jgi:hypothetical protein